MIGTETVTLGMGCFWSPEALFGQVPGVIRTRVGYAGGTLDSPTYRQMGDHSETVEIEFDPAIVTMEDILELFWSSHKPDSINGYKGRQYLSLLQYRDAAQREAMLRVKLRMEQDKGAVIDTGIAPFAAFYPAEDKHQKYYLKRYPDAVAKLALLYPPPGEPFDSTLAARLNGLAKGYTNMERIRNEIGGWKVSEPDRERMLRLLRQIRW